MSASGSAHPTFFRTPMMDDAVADPAGRQLWGGNDKGLFKMVPIDTVVDAIVVPRRWEPISALRVIVDPLTDLALDRNTELHGLLRQLETRTGNSQHCAVPTVPAAPTTNEKMRGAQQG